MSCCRVFIAAEENIINAYTLTESQSLPEENELAQRAGAGDVDAIAVLYDRYADGLHHLLVAILGSTTDAEDALQEVFVKLACGRMARVRDLRAYLFTAVRHEAYNMLRRRRRERPLEAVDLETAGTATPSSDIQALLHQLPIEQREVIALKVYEGMTFSEIAAIVKASPNTVASRYRYGIEKLRGWLQEEENHAN